MKKLDIVIITCDDCFHAYANTESKCPYCNKMSFEQWLEQSDEDLEYISMLKTAWDAGQANK